MILNIEEIDEVYVITIQRAYREHLNRKKIHHTLENTEFIFNESTQEIRKSKIDFGAELKSYLQYK